MTPDTNSPSHVKNFSGQPYGLFVPPAIPRRFNSGWTLTLLGLLSVLISMYLGFRVNLYPVHPGLDASWVYAINLAAARGWHWGRDFIFTYGPYGYLIHTMDIGDLPTRRLMFDAVLAVGSGITTAVYVYSTNLRVPTQLVSLALLSYALQLQDAEYKWLSFIVILTLTGLHLNGRASQVAHAIGGLAAGFSMLMKFSLGFGAVLTVAVCSIAARPWRLIPQRTALTAGAVTAGFLIGWLSYSRSLGGLTAYLATAWQVSSGFSSAMSLAPDGWWITAISFMTFGVLLAAWAVALRSNRSLLSFTGLAVPLFVAWKHSIVRQDPHVLILIIFGFFVLAVLFVDALTVWTVRRAAAAAGILLVPLLIPWFRPEGGGYGLGARLSRPLNPGPAGTVAALLDFRAYRAFVQQVSNDALKKSVLPAAMRQTIGLSPVDVYPWETSYIPANGLAWLNRPLPASYSTYTPALDDLNAAFFESDHRPPYIVWPLGIGVGSIDGRHLFWDEPKTLRSILNRYDLVQPDSEVGLLHARTQPRFGPSEQLGTVTMRWGKWVPVPQVSGVLLAHMTVGRRVTTRVKRWIFREDPVFLSLRLVAGEEVTYRLVPDNMGSGLWISPLPITKDDLVSILRGGTARQVVAVRIHSARFAKLSSRISLSWSRLTRID